MPILPRGGLKRGRPTAEGKTDSDRKLGKRAIPPTPMAKAAAIGRQVVAGEVQTPAKEVKPRQPLPEGILVPPDDFDDEAYTRWIEINLVLKVKRILSPDFFGIIENLCRMYSRIRMIQAAIKLDGVTVGGARGQVRQHPLLPEETRLRSAITLHLSHFGLSPASSRNANIRVTGYKGIGMPEDDKVESRDRKAGPEWEDEEGE